jgi:BirA family biotin operon repressor/biotin-[acetyl-CoA-carboxylase] ligase
VVVGLGLNVRWPPPDGAPGTPGPAGELDDLRLTATSIWRETGRDIPPSAMLDPVLMALEPRLADLASAQGRHRLAGEYRRRCSTLGRAVRVSGVDETFTGTATDISESGHLLVDVGACIRTVAAGDVVHLRDLA